jgi:hypothetical protein
LTIIVSVKINDGVVMAADSAATFATVPAQQMYVHSNKIVNLYKGLPIGVMWAGSGNFGSESTETLMKDLRRRFTKPDPLQIEWKLEPGSFTMKEVAEKLYKFLVEEKLPTLSEPAFTKMRVCGYSSGRPLAEVWEVVIKDKDTSHVVQVMNEASFGPRWDGEYELLNRLILGLSGATHAALGEIGLNEIQIEKAVKAIVARNSVGLHINAMPIQDAINLASFLVRTTIDYNQFLTGTAKTVAGEVEIAAITKHEGFRWIRRKHFYPAALGAQ